MAQDYMTWASYEDPKPLKGFDDNRSLLIWSLQHSTIVGNWLQLQIPSRSQGELSDLRTSNSNVGLLTTGSIATSRKLMYFLSTYHRFSLDQEAEFCLLISANPVLAAILVRYHIDGHNQLTYSLWKNWVFLGLQCIAYKMDKTIASLNIIEHCPPYLLEVAKLTALQNQLMLSEKSKHDLQAFGKIVVQLQSRALSAFTVYFALVEPDIHLADARQSFVRSYCDAFHVEIPGTLTIRRMIRFNPRGILHLHLQRRIRQN